MLAPATVGEIRLLLAEGGLSQREIARRLGVSRGSVNAIARGKRTDGADFVCPSGPVERCPGCGCMVQMPCLACRIRAMRER